MGKTSDDAVPAVRSWRGRRGLALAVVLPALALSVPALIAAAIFPSFSN